MEPTYTATYADLYLQHWWWRVRERILLKKIHGLLGDGANHTRILDVGCGAGLFFDALEKFGHVEGVDSNVDVVARSGRWKSRIYVGTLDTFKASRTFDLILLLDIVEHVVDAGGLLHETVRLLAPNGRILITVPAFQWLWTSHDELNHHVKRYTAEDMRRLVQHSGLEVTETRYLFQSLVVPKLLVRMCEAVRPPVATVPRVPPRTLNRMLERWYQSEAAIAGWLPFGSSVMAVARATQ